MNRFEHRSLETRHFETRDPRSIAVPDAVAPILLTGATGFLGGHFLLHRIEWPGTVYALVRGDSPQQARARLYAHLAECAASYQRALPKALLDARLQVLVGDITLPDCGLDPRAVQTLRDADISGFWHCAASLKFEDRHRREIMEQNADGTRHMLELFRKTCASRTAGAPAEFVHVSTAYTAGKTQGDIDEVRHSLDREYNNVYEESKNIAENSVIDFCDAHAFSYRILRPTAVMGPRASHHSGTTRFGVYGFTKEVFRLRETLVKLKHPLELLGKPRASMNLTPVDECVYDMMHMAATGFGGRRFFHLCNPEGVNMEKLIGMVDRKTGTERLAFVYERGPDSSPLQELFDERTKFYAGYYNAEKRFLRAASPQPQLDWDDVDRYVASFLTELEQEEAGGVGFRPQTISARDGVSLRVFSCGNPTLPPLVLANAYGMPAEFMWPLAQRLQEHFHVLTWECRWVPGLDHAFDPEACGSIVHAQDMIDVLKALGVGRASVAGWSSGAQVALRALGTFPDRLQAGVLLNPGVSISPSETVRVTRFESGIRSLFDKIAGNYRMAEKYCELIYGAASTDAGDTKMLSTILTSTDPYLLYMTSMPFRTAESLYRYANMMRTLFAERPDAWTQDVTQPVLVYVGDEDVVTHPDIGKALCAGLRQGELHHDPEGDHFAHYYEQRIADMIRGALAVDQQNAA
ncbi:alpha/beta fold hydrolase [Luteimonas abyssi]|uniref:alpha/beta fold hydrolase n=1 Tax=Luteimonas abyssi TaxID=1247514 RepID=UPI000737C518|nr:alpha/beta fold hydrolase [Luteimonas abyssi]